MIRVEFSTDFLNILPVAMVTQMVMVNCSYLVLRSSAPSHGHDILALNISLLGEVEAQ